nr:hypothetical protein BaRGS_028677 [Batillaria attramentaria]
MQKIIRVMHAYAKNAWSPALRELDPDPEGTVPTHSDRRLMNGKDRLKAVSSSYNEQLGDVGTILSDILCLGDNLARTRAVLATWRRWMSEAHEEGTGVELREGGKLVALADSQWSGAKAPPFLKDDGTGKQ